MSQNSSIEWTECTWNPIAGCSKCSPGCANCYGLPMANRLSAMKQQKYCGTTNKRNGKLAWSGELKLDEEALELPERWKKPHTIFVNSMSDLFHDNIPEAWIRRVFKAMLAAPQHRYQVLTKRSDRLLQLSPRLPWQPNIWMGVSVENKDYTFRIDHLRQTGAQVKFLSLEPLLGPIPGLNLEGIHWVIVGGESGPGARRMEPEWVRDIRDRCVVAQVPFFFKQWGGRNKKRSGRILDGRTWDQMPVASPQSASQ